MKMLNKLKDLISNTDIEKLQDSWGSMSSHKFSKMTEEEYYSLKPKYIKVDLLDFKKGIDEWV